MALADVKQLCLLQNLDNLQPFREQVMCMLAFSMRK